MKINVEIVPQLMFCLAAPMDDITKILAPNFSEFEIALCKAVCTHQLPVNLDINWNTDLMAVNLLPFGAWQLSLDEWNTNWPESVKRAQIKIAPIVHRKKGTIGSIRRILSAFGAACTIKEWWQKVPKGIPHTFDIMLMFSNINGAQPTSEYLNNVLKMIEATKPERSHFTFSVASNIINENVIIGIVRSVNFVALDLVA